jgi:hypothetical protein
MMRTGAAHSMVFTPPPEPRQAAVETSAAPDAPALYAEPQDGVLLLGEMFRDSKVIEEKLKKLPFAGEAYRGDLRVIRGAAKRIADRCAKLLGESDADPR